MVCIIYIAVVVFVHGTIRSYSSCSVASLAKVFMAQSADLCTAVKESSLRFSTGIQRWNEWLCDSQLLGLAWNTCLVFFIHSTVEIFGKRNADLFSYGRIYYTPFWVCVPRNHDLCQKKKKQSDTLKPGNWGMPTQPSVSWRLSCRLSHTHQAVTMLSWAEGWKCRIKEPQTQPTFYAFLRLLVSPALWELFTTPILHPESNYYKAHCTIIEISLYQ